MVPAIEGRTGVRFAYVPVLLGGVFKATGNVSPAVSLRGIKNKGEYAALETRRFLAKHGITRYAPNPFFPVNTLQIMRGAVAAQRARLLTTATSTRSTGTCGRTRRRWTSPRVIRGGAARVRAARPIELLALAPPIPT